MNSKRIECAISYAVKHYSGLKRKYTGFPYVVHPLAVASIVETVTDDENMYIAALFHDLVEDTKLTIGHIRGTWGNHVADLVDELTDVSKPEDGNRKIRKNIDLIHISNASPRAKTIKLADMINNSASIIKHDSKFAKTYIEEKELLLEVLKEGDIRLYMQAFTIVDDFKNSVVLRYPAGAYEIYKNITKPVKEVPWNAYRLDTTKKD